MPNGQLASIIRFTRNDDFTVSVDIDGEVFVSRQSFTSEYHTFQCIISLLARRCASAALHANFPAEVIDRFNVMMFPSRVDQTSGASVKALVEFLEDAMSFKDPSPPLLLESHSRSFDEIPRYGDTVETLLHQPFDQDGFCCERKHGQPHFNIEQRVYGGPNAPRMDWKGDKSQTMVLSSNVLNAYAQLAGIAIGRAQSYRICAQFVEEFIAPLSMEGGVIALLEIDDFLMSNIDC